MSNNKQSSLYKEFVPYEEALALKELGFDEPCFGFYERDKELVIQECEITDFHFDSLQCVAPTFSQAFRFLREKHNLYGVIIPTVKMYWTFKTMTVVESIIEVPPYKHIDANDYRTYEEAELARLKKLIEIVKGGNK